MDAIPPIVRQIAAGIICVVFSLCLMGGISNAANESSSQAAQTQQTSQKTRKENASAKEDQKSETEDAEPEDENYGESSDTCADLIVKFLDVGQGDAALIEFPNGKTMLIDTPTDEASTVTSALTRDGRKSIDWLIATHPDADHIGGLEGVIGAAEVGSIWASEANSSTQTYTDFLTAVANKGLSIEPAYAGRRIATGENYAIDILWPRQGAAYSEKNTYSTVIKVTYGDTSFLFTGDAPVEAQDQSIDGHVDVLKVSHHGSASGLSSSLASKLSPSIAVLSYGNNSYGHPTQVVLDALSSVGCQTFGTHVNGTITVTSNGRDVKASVEREGTIVAASQDAGASSRGLGATDENGGSSGQSSTKAISSDNAQSSDTSGGNGTVVVTPTGSKYHRSGCRTLSRSKSLTEMTKSQAKANGYTPCKVCNP